MGRATVAAVIPTKNSEKVLRGALDSLWFCDEVIVVDMHSSDRTPAICAEYPNVRYFSREGYIYGNFNFGVEQARADWIIRLDSDERLSTELQDEILALLVRGPDRDVFDAPFYSYFIGHPIKHGSGEEQGTRKTLFRKGTLCYKVRSEHEDLTPVDATGTLTHGKLKNPYLHFSTPSLSKFLKKLDYYTEKDCARADAKDVRVYPPWRVVWIGGRHFMRQYLTLHGYRDGYHGFALAAFNAMYQVVQLLKGWEMKNGLRKLHDDARDAFDAEQHANYLCRTGRERAAG